jgi:hypothetical protein
VDTNSPPRLSPGGVSSGSGSAGPPTDSDPAGDRAAVRLSRLDTWLLAHYAEVVFLAGGLIALNQVNINRRGVILFDPLWLTGAAAYLILLRFALLLPVKVDDTLDRLCDRRVLRSAPAQEIRVGLHASARRWAAAMGLFTSGLVVLSYITAFHGRLLTEAAVETVAAIPVGRFLGQAIGYGLLGHRLCADGVEVTVQTEHPDEAAGLGPVGDLYAYQAGLIAAAGAFVGVWWVLAPAFGTEYDNWRSPYLGLLVFLIGCEVAAFGVPLLAFRRILVDRKAAFRRHADRLWGDTAEMDERLRDLAEQESGENAEHAARQSRAKQRYDNIVRTPNWPVTPRLRRRLAARNLALLLPFLTPLLPVSVAAGANHLLHSLGA